MLGDRQITANFVKYRLTISLMRQVLANVPNVDSFVDDMWIFTETWEAHMTSLRQVLDRLRSA